MNRDVVERPDHPCLSFEFELERETGFEPAALSLGRESDPEEDQWLALHRPADRGKDRHIAAHRTAPNTGYGTAAAPIGRTPTPIGGVGLLRPRHLKNKRGSGRSLPVDDGDSQRRAQRARKTAFEI